MNWCLGIVAVLLGVAILRQSQKPDVDYKEPEGFPRSLLDHLEAITAGGKAQEAGPTINPTGQQTSMITYDKL